MGLRSALGQTWSLLTRDDLFLRVVFLLFGLALSAGSLFVALWLAFGHADLGSVWLLAVVWVLSLGFLGLGTLLLCACIASPRSRVARLARRVDYIPDLDNFILFVIVALVFLLIVPSALTLILRILGMRGYSWNEYPAA